MLVVSLILILLIEVHSHEASLNVSIEIAPSLQQDGQSFPQEKFPSAADAWRHPVVKCPAITP